MKDREQYYCGECSGDCYGEVHDFNQDGEAWGSNFRVECEQFLSSCCGSIMFYRKNNVGDLSGEVPMEQAYYG
jgi:hypothetical protein|tara:strand:+ start:286 stop:504 length:219 start_codon:yes stop_codon:yes gene_type:complete